MKKIDFRLEESAAAQLDQETILRMMEENGPLLAEALKGHEEYKESLGWLDPKEWAGETWLTRYEELAEEVRKDADVLVVVGIGGSNQAARAVAEAIGERGQVKLCWAGNNISAYEVNQVLDSLQGQSVYVNVIAKNFETLEPGIGFRAMRDFMRKQYDEDYNKRLICTGTEGSYFETLSKEHGYKFLPFPKDVGGRFTALTSVGLFPLAVAGFRIRAIADGAAGMRDRLLAESTKENMALKYAAIRKSLYDRGFRMEMLSFFEPRLFRFAKWWMQLFGESEGKQDKGLYPLFGNFSEDLHSVGQFLQEGTPVLFETFVNVQDSGASYLLKNDGIDDHFSYLDGKDFDEINRAAFHATLKAHSKRYPCIVLDIPALDEESFGQLFYFFEFACYLSARLLGVNPFDQPGVEEYKQHMFHLLGKGMPR